MKIRQIRIRNFRLLKNFSLDLEDELSLVIGKNNTGKTSILTILEKFLNPSEKSRITSDDFNLDFKKEIQEMIMCDGILDKEKYEKTQKVISLRLLIEYIYNRVKQVKFSEFQKLYDYLEGFTPFSTQHKTKGAEFNNVLVILDNGGWNSSYNFEKLFLNSGSKSVLRKSQKIFYMCCTRAKENLGVFFHNPSKAVIDKAKEWFGESNVVNIK